MVHTRTIRFADGRQEIVRVLSANDLVSWREGDPLAYEKSIVWLEDIQSVPYVRMVEVRCARSRRGRLHLKSGEHVIGYAKLLPDAPRDPVTDRYTRRLFYLKAADQAPATTGVPRNAVDPMTVFPGIAGQPPRS